ncbi:DUF4124 domain-containing protein [Ottowia sp. VDI28]|uniref:DUF4124 domain-containing protein n=1 Tax=Ottowia sp. VDI28 TaxID=3133968 RepID=UPI003C2EB7F2
MNFTKSLLLFATSRPSRLITAAMGLMALCCAVLAQPTPPNQGASGPGIYSCVDAQGKRLSADRPIADCSDREQRQLSRSGVTRRTIGPTMSVNEREAREAREREAVLTRQRAQENMRRDRALLSRYPDKVTHDASRRDALAPTQSVIDAAGLRITELAHERKALDDEMEFYRKDPSRAPAQLRRRLESNAHSVQQQQQAIAEQTAERGRINARFDEELARLQQLWGGQPNLRMAK